MPNPIDDEDLYDSLELGGVRSPGKLTLSGHNDVNKWDIKSGSGQKGATMTLKARDPATFLATFYLVRDTAIGVDDFADWDAFLEVVNSTTSGATPKALDVYHPDLEEVGIRSVVKAEVIGSVHDGKGGVTKSVKFTEYLPPKKKGGTPSGSKSSAKAPDPNQAAKDELAKLTAEYQRTPWG